MNRPDSNDPPKRERTEMDPHERQFWDLDDEEDLLDDEEGSLASDENSSIDQPVSPLPPPVEESEAEPLPEMEEEGTDADEMANQTSPEQESSGTPTPSNSPLEKISLAAFGVLIAGVVVWALLLFFRELPTDDPSITVKFPVSGKSLTVSGIETYWRAPDRSKDRGVQTDIVLLPAALLTLSPTQGTSVLRALFEDDNGTLIGDPVTLEISEGIFTDNNQDTIEIYSTGGFTNQGDFPAYLTQQIELWHLIIKEGPDINARGSQFKEIIRMSIAPERQ